MNGRSDLEIGWGSTPMRTTRTPLTQGANLTRAERHELIVDHLPLVRSLAARYANRGERFDDLFQVGVVGLITAIDRFDPSRGTRLTTYATATVLGELRRHFRDDSRLVRVPRRLQNEWALVAVMSDELRGRLQRNPSVSEIAAELRWADDDVIDALAARNAAQPLPLVGPGGPDNDVTVDVAVDEPGFEWAEGRATIRANLHRLSPRERTILHLRFKEGRSQAQIAEQVGVSQMHVSRLLKRALGRLRNDASEDSQPRIPPASGFSACHA